SVKGVNSCRRRAAATASLTALRPNRRPHQTRPGRILEDPRYTASHHADHDLPPEAQVSHRNAVTIRPESRWPRHHALLLEPCAGGSKGLAPRPHEKGGSVDQRRSSRQHLRATR